MATEDDDTTEDETAKDTDTPPRPKLDFEAGVSRNIPFATPFQNAWEILRTEEITIEKLIAMRNTDGQARALYGLIVLPIRAAVQGAVFQVEKNVEGGEEEAEFIENMFTLPASAGGMVVPFAKFIAQMLLAVFDGFSTLEMVYNKPPKSGPLKGKLTLQKFAYRAPETITFLVDDHGNYAGMRQRANALGKITDVPLPKEHTIYYACFTGGTKVALLDGTNPPISEVVRRVREGEELWTYSVDGDAKIVPGKISYGQSMGVRNLVRVTLDNGESIRCTPDHKFMLRDGSYKEAQKLSSGDSLMPLYRQERPVGRSKSPYEQVYVPGENAYKFTHRVVGDFLYGPGKTGMVTHHVNVNRYDNSPSNLQRITNEEHRAVHDELCRRAKEALTKLWAEPEWAAEQTNRIKEGLNKPEVRAKLEAAAKDPVRLAKISAGKRPHARKDVTFEVVDAEYRSNPRSCRRIAETLGVSQKLVCLRVQDAGFTTWTQYVKGLGPRPAKELSDDARQAISERTKERLSVQWLDEEYRQRMATMSSERMHGLWADEEWKETQKEKLREGWVGRRNHKVVEVEFLEESEEVFDITVDEYHNFALTSGVFVSNCNEEENPFYGRSMFTAAFYHWDKKVKMEYIMHLAAQRAAVGTRVGETPPGASKQEKADFKKALANMTVAQHIMVPVGYKVTSLQETGNFDFLGVVNYHNSQMSKSVLAQFFDKNQGAGDNDGPVVDFGQQSDALFLLMLKSIMDDIAEIINQKVIPRFIDWNFGTGKYPTFRWGELTPAQKTAIKETFEKLMTGKTTPEFDLALEDKYADMLGLEINYEELKEEALEQKKQDKAMMDAQMQQGMMGAALGGDPATSMTLDEAQATGATNLPGGGMAPPAVPGMEGAGMDSTLAPPPSGGSAAPVPSSKPEGEEEIATASTVSLGSIPPQYLPQGFKLSAGEEEPS